MFTKQDLLDARARLQKEIEEIDAQIERDGAPEGWAWCEGSEDGSSLRWTLASARIAWDTHDHSAVYIQNGERYLSLDAPALFAWVDRVREKGETDL